MKRKIERALKELEIIELENYLKKENLKIYATSNLDEKEDGCLCGNKIFVRKHLPHNYRRFVILHELGHYIMHKRDSLAFSYTNLGYRNKLEVEADMFACLKMLSGNELVDVNIIDLLQRKGVPKNIAIRFTEWYQH